MGVSAGQLTAAAGCNAIHLFSSSVAAGICPGGVGVGVGGSFCGRDGGDKDESRLRRHQRDVFVVNNTATRELAVKTHTFF